MITIKVFKTEICINLYILFTPCFCFQIWCISHVKIVYGFCGNIEGGNIELFFTKRERKLRISTT